MILSKFIFFLQFIFSIQFISIPFKNDIVSIPNDLSPQDLIKHLIQNEIYTEVNIGNPNQKLTFFINFNSYHTYILEESKEEKKYIQYYSNKSSTFKKYQNKSTKYSDNDFNSGFNVSDIITINQYFENYNLNFILVSKTNNLTKTNFVGSLGFGVTDMGQPFAKSAGLTYQLKLNNLTDNLLFTLVFNRNDYNGKIIIGKNIYIRYVDDFFTSDYTIIDTDYRHIWGWNYFIIKFNDTKFDVRNIKIKPELGLNIFPKEFYVKYKSFFSNKIKDKKCYEGNFLKYYFFYCDYDVNFNDIPYLIFQNKRPNNITFKIETKDLIFNYGDKKYFLIVFDSSNESHDNIYLGYPFLKNYDLIFNLENRHLGFYNFKMNFDEKEEQEKEKKKKEKEKKKKEDEKKDKEKDKKKKDEKEKDDEKKEKEEEEKDKKIIPEEFRESNSKKYLVIALFFIIIIILFFIFIQYRNSRRKKAITMKEDFEYMEQI